MAKFAFIVSVRGEVRVYSRAADSEVRSGHQHESELFLLRSLCSGLFVEISNRVGRDHAATVRTRLRMRASTRCLLLRCRGGLEAFVEISNSVGRDQVVLVLT